MCLMFQGMLSDSPLISFTVWLCELSGGVWVFNLLLLKFLISDFSQVTGML